LKTILEERKKEEEEKKRDEIEKRRERILGKTRYDEFVKRQKSLDKSNK